MSNTTLELIQRELALRKKPSDFILENFLFKEQLEFVRDPSPFKTAVCSRRGGKTTACAGDLTETSTAQSDVISLYITLSRNNAKKLIWPEIKKINREYQLEGVPNESELSMTYPRGGLIYCSGASDRSQIEKFRGLPLKKVYIDESQSFPPYIRDLIDDVIGPALMDHAGSLSLIGTPGPVPAGFFYDCSHSESWSNHAWTFFQNPFIAKKSGMSHQDILNRELKRRGVSIEDPSIQREWFGKWVLDSDSLVFHYKADINHYEELPPSDYIYIMGVDFGFEDADAIAILAWSEKSPVTYLVHEMVVAKQGLTPLIAQIEELRAKFKISKIVADFGGLGKKISEEFIRRFQIPMTPAEKVRKFESIELMNDALRTGRFRAKKNSRFAADSMLVEWDRDKSTPEKKKVSDRFHSDILDAALYAFRESPAFAYTPPPIEIKRGTPEWAEKEITDMERAAEEYFESVEGEKSEWQW